MDLWIGTSGFSYPEWKGSFYPEKLPASKMFAFYSQHFSTVEINATFYRMPKDNVIDGWIKAAPEGFRYTLKAPKFITTIRRLQDCTDSLLYFLGRAHRLGAHRAALLFHLPPFFKKDVVVLKEFLSQLPPETRAAFEFRSDTWHDDAVYSTLSEAGAALVISEGDKIRTPFVATTDWGYLRLRDEGYEEVDIAQHLEQIRGQKWKEAFVYFKHEDVGKGAHFALQMKALAGQTAAVK